MDKLFLVGDAIYDGCSWLHEYEINWFVSIDLLFRYNVSGFRAIEVIGRVGGKFAKQH